MASRHCLKRPIAGTPSFLSLYTARPSLAHTPAVRARCLLALQCCQYPQTAEENVRTVRHVAALSVHLGSHSAGDDSSTSCVTQQRTRSAQDGCSDNSPYDCVTYVAGGRYMLHVLPPSGVTCVAYGLQHTKHSPARLVMLAVRGGCLFFKTLCVVLGGQVTGGTQWVWLCR